MPNIKVEPTIPNYPPQGIQAQLDLLYLWNPDVANDLIEQLNTALEEVTSDLSAYLTKDEADATYATITTVNGKQDALTAEQLAAVNSGITAEHVTTYDGYAAEISQAQADATKAENAAEVAQQTANLAGQEAAQALTQLAGKQATLTEPQLNAVNSGITADKVRTYDGYQTDLTTLDGDVADLGSQITEIQQNINTLNTTVSGKANTADLPQNQTGTTGQVYTKTEDGAEWADAQGSSLPDQTGNAGKFLTTDGASASWGEVQAAAITTDATLTGTGTTDSPLGIAQSVKDSIDGKLPLAGGEFASGATVILPGTMRLINETSTNQHWDLTCEDGWCMTFTCSNSIRDIKWSFTTTALRYYGVNPKSVNLGDTACPFRRAYVGALNNGAEIAIPTTGGTLALLSDIPDTSNLATKTEVQQEIQDAIGTIETALAEV